MLRKGTTSLVGSAANHRIIGGVRYESTSSKAFFGASQRWPQHYISRILPSIFDHGPRQSGRRPFSTWSFFNDDSGRSSNNRMMSTTTPLSYYDGNIPAHLLDGDGNENSFNDTAHEIITFEELAKMVSSLAERAGSSSGAKSLLSTINSTIDAASNEFPGEATALSPTETHASLEAYHAFLSAIEKLENYLHSRGSASTMDVDDMEKHIGRYTEAFRSLKDTMFHVSDNNFITVNQSASMENEAKQMMLDFVSTVMPTKITSLYTEFIGASKSVAPTEGEAVFAEETQQKTLKLYLTTLQCLSEVAVCSNDLNLVRGTMVDEMLWENKRNYMDQISKIVLKGEGVVKDGVTSSALENEAADELRKCHEQAEKIIFQTLADITKYHYSISKTSPVHDTAQYAYDLLQKLEESYAQTIATTATTEALALLVIQPTRELYESVVAALRYSVVPSAIAKKNSIATDLHYQQAAQQDPSLRLNRRQQRRLQNQWNVRALQMAESVRDRSNRMIPDAQGDRYILPHMIHMYALSSRRGNVAYTHQASEYLVRLRQRYKSCATSVDEYVSVLEAWKNCAFVKPHLLPSRRKLGLGLGARPAMRAWVFLKNMEDKALSSPLNIRPSMECYKAVLQAFKGDSLFWSGSVSAGVGSSSKSNVEYTNHLMDTIITKHKEHENFSPPDVDCFSVALRELSCQVGNSYKHRHGDKAMKYLQELENLHSSYPSKYPLNWQHYTFVLQALDNCLADPKEAGPKAEQVLLKFEQRFDKAREQVQARSNLTLADMKAEIEAINERLAPRASSYEAAIGAHAQRPDETKASKVMNILQRMQERYDDLIAHVTDESSSRSDLEDLNQHLAKPTTSCYNAVLKVCAKPPKHMTMQQRKQQFTSALSVAKKLQSSNDLTPNPSTYFWLLKACETCFSLPPSDCPWLKYLSNRKKNELEQILAPQREEAARTIFREAAKYGCVDRQNVLKQLKLVVNASTYKELTGVSVDATNIPIPPSWRANVVDDSPFDEDTNKGLLQNTEREDKDSVRLEDYYYDMNDGEHSSNVFTRELWYPKDLEPHLICKQLGPANGPKKPNPLKEMLQGGRRRAWMTEEGTE